MSNVLRELNSITLKLKQLLRQQQKDLSQIQRLILNLEKSLDELWSEQNCANNLQRSSKPAELISLLTSSRINSIVALAENVLHPGKMSPNASWAGDGKSYARWLGTGFLTLARLGSTFQYNMLLPMSKSLLSQALSFGYQDILVETIVFDKHGFAASSEIDMVSLLPDLTRPIARRFVVSLLNVTQRKLIKSDIIHGAGNRLGHADDPLIAGAAALLKPIFARMLDGEDMEYLFSTILRVASDCLPLLRAIMISVSDTQQVYLLEKSWQAFNDPLSIVHSSKLQQTALSQLLCLSVGKVYRRENMRVFLLARSGMYTKGISSRLKSSSPQVRSLGMAVAVIISRLVDKEDNRITFEFSEDDSLMLDELQRLIDNNDCVGSLQQLTGSLSTFPERLQLQADKPSGPHMADRPENWSLQLASSDQVDGEDSDQDLQLISRHQYESVDDGKGTTSATGESSKAPVFIRQLIENLQDSEDPTRFSQSISEASILIRRKADFGSELKDHCRELAAVLLALRSPFEIEGLDEMQRQAMTALLVAETGIAGPYYCHSYFFGDCNTKQKVLILDSITLAARTLTGHSRGIVSETLTKYLAPHIHKAYYISGSALLKDSISGQHCAAPDRFSHLTDAVAISLFFPLIGNGHFHAKHGYSSTATLLCSAYLDTLSIVLSTTRFSRVSGQMVLEYWKLLLDLRGMAVANRDILESVLIGTLTIVEINKDSPRLVEFHRRDIAETFRWVEAINETVIGPSNSGQIQKLTATLLIELNDLVASSL